MKKVIEFIKKYKAEILIALGAISSIIASISTMSGVNATICSISTHITAGNQIRYPYHDLPVDYVGFYFSPDQFGPDIHPHYYYRWYWSMRP